MDVIIAIPFLGTLAWIALWGASVCVDRAFARDRMLADDGYPVTLPMLPAEAERFEEAEDLSFDHNWEG